MRIWVFSTAVWMVLFAAIAVPHFKAIKCDSGDQVFIVRNQACIPFNAILPAK